MRKAIAVLLALLLIPAIPTAEAESNLLEVGIVDTIDGRFIHTSFSSSSTMITLTTTGNLSEHFWGSGELITQWSIELNTTANSATPDATGLQIAVAHTGGVYIVNTELKIVTSEYNTSNSVDAVAWDSEGDLWFGFYGGERRAKEFDSLEETGETTEAHNTAMTAMTIISQDRMNDLALLKIKEKTRIKKFANFRNKSVVLGEKVVAMGYPYGKTVSSEIKLTSGSVSSLSGLGDEFTRMQIDAALQPGNSGGPLFDKAGNVIGVAVAKASLWAFLEAFGTLPENVNFGIKPSVVKTFLDSNNIRYKTTNYSRDIGTEKIAKKGSDSTVYIQCLIRKDKLAKINKQREKN